MFEVCAGMPSNEPAVLIKQSSLTAGSQRSREEVVASTGHGRELPRKAGTTQGFQGIQNEDSPHSLLQHGLKVCIESADLLRQASVKYVHRDGGLALLCSALIIITSNGN